MNDVRLFRRFKTLSTFIMELITDSFFVQDLHEFINNIRDLHTKRQVFTSPVPVPISRNHIQQHLHNYEYVFCPYQHEGYYDRCLLVLYRYTIVLFFKNGFRHYRLPRSTYPPSLDGTIIDAHYRDNTLILKDVLAYNHRKYYCEYFDARFDVLKSIQCALGTILAPIEVQLTEYTNYHTFIYNTIDSETMDWSTMENIVFVPKTLSMGINMQRTSFVYERYPLLILFVSKNDETIRLSCWNNERTEQILFASSTDVRWENVAEEQHVGLVQYKDDAYDYIEKCDPSKQVFTLRVLEQIFVMYKETIEPRDLFDLKTHETSTA